ncbi:mitochondrial import inner membrane translocase subunit Tim10 B [Lampetra fluviatilis]
MDEAQMQMRNLKDFLLVYNAMSEHCFTRCVSNLNVRSLTADEESCVSRCAGRGVRTAHRVMTSYLTMMPEIVERRSEEQRRALSDAAAIGDDPTGVTASAGVAGVTEGVAGVTEGVAEGVADGVAGVTAGDT